MLHILRDSQESIHSYSLFLSVLRPAAEYLKIGKTS